MSVLSFVAKTDKLLKVLQRSDDDCSHCSESPAVEHIHYVLSEQQFIEIPDLIDGTDNQIKNDSNDNDFSQSQPQMRLKKTTGGGVFGNYLLTQKSNTCNQNDIKLFAFLLFS